MKILLFGEFSGFFNCLKDGLMALGHEVFLLAMEMGGKIILLILGGIVIVPKIGASLRLFIMLRMSCCIKSYS